MMTDNRKVRTGEADLATRTQHHIHTLLIKLYFSVMLCVFVCLYMYIAHGSCVEKLFGNK